MFGMSSEEFWEQSPQLYWAYRIFYLKKNEQESELQKYNSWLQGNITFLATQLAIANCFSKEKQEFPSYEKMFKEKEQEEIKKLTPKEKEQRKNIMVQEEFNAWARF